MKILHSETELRAWRRSAGSEPVVLVPTMGALHAGHGQLVRTARELAGAAGQVVVTVFVNPLQFGPNEDFSRYPRELKADAEKCAGAGADVVFAPSVEEVYASDRSIIILEKSLSQVLCGASRPGHFDGVCTVVAKLFNYVQPDVAVFGKKDAQQLAIIRRMVRDLNYPIVLHAAGTVREGDGLAMSSRNRYQGPDERAQAPALNAALRRVRAAWESGERDVERLLRVAAEHIAEHASLGRVDYLSLVDAETLQPLVDAAGRDALMALAVFFGGARLIDNVELPAKVISTRVP